MQSSAGPDATSWAGAAAAMTSSGGPGRDLIWAGNDDRYCDQADAMPNIVRGNEGNDRLFGDRGADELFGGAGDDTLEGCRGVNSLDGGDGEDECLSGALILNCENMPIQRRCPRPTLLRLREKMGISASYIA